MIDLTAHGGGTITLTGVATDDLDGTNFSFYQDTYTGTDGDDTLEGGAGDDTLTGGAGDDTLTGGEGRDIFVFGAGDGDDTITDFTDRTDLIDLSAFAGIAGFDDLTISDNDDGNSVIDLSDHGGGTIMLTGVETADLDRGYFVFYQDTYIGTDGDDTLEGGHGDDTLTGGAGADTFVFAAGHGDDTVTDLTDGEDLIDLSAFVGITSFDDLTVSDNADGHAVIDLTAHGGGTITLTGVATADLDGDDFTFYQDTYTGTDGADTLAGGAGADTITGLAGDDTLTGGAGADTFVFAAGHGTDTVTDFTDGEDLIDLSAFTGITSFDELTVADNDDGNAVIDLTAHGGGTITLTGVATADLDGDNFTFYQDTYTGTADIDTLAGGAGADTITGLAGDDTLTGGAGADTFVFAAGHGTDTVTDFTDGEDLIDLSAFTGITSFDELTVADNDDSNAVIDLTAHGGGTITLTGVATADLDGDNFTFYQDTYTGTDGADTLAGGAGADTITGLAGDDTLTGGAGADTFVFAADHGDDTITDFTDGEDLIDLSAFTGITSFDELTVADNDDGNAVIDLTAHGGGTITLTGVATADLDGDNFTFYQDTYTGTADIDTLAGGAGADTITGLAGDDTLTGGAGADTFVFAAGHGADTIMDFTNGEDLIDLSAFAAITGFDDLTVTQEGDDVKIDLSGETGGGTITLQSFELDDLDANDFVFYEIPPDGG